MISREFHLLDIAALPRQCRVPLPQRRVLKGRLCDTSLTLFQIMRRYTREKETLLWNWVPGLAQAVADGYTDHYLESFFRMWFGIYPVPRRPRMQDSTYERKIEERKQVSYRSSLNGAFIIGLTYHLRVSFTNCGLALTCGESSSVGMPISHRFIQSLPASLRFRVPKRSVALLSRSSSPTLKPSANLRTSRPQPLSLRLPSQANPTCAQLRSKTEISSSIS